MDFNPSLLQEEEKAYGKLVDFKKELLDKAPDENSYISPSVNHPAAGALMDDLNTPAAIGEVFKIIIPLLDRFYSGTHSRKDIEKGFKALGVIENILGIKLPAEKGADEKEIQKLLVQRQRLREKKYFDRADRIREKLYKMGIKIKDTPTGPRWKKINKD